MKKLMIGAMAAFLPLAAMAGTLRHRLGVLRP